MDLSSDDENPFYKPEQRTTPLRKQNNISKRRRSSMASFAILQDELQSPGEKRTLKQGRSSRDRFIANSLEKSIPFCATPRSRRLAKLVGEAKDRTLVFHGESVNLSIRSREAIPYHRELRQLTKNLYEVPTPKSLTSASTNLCSQPEICLGAPKLDDDFYSRATAWSNTDLLAVAMRTSVVYRNMETHAVWRLRSFAEGEESATCLKWSPNSDKLAVGNDLGYVRVYDPMTRDCLRVYDSHHKRDFVGDLSWRDDNVFTVGYQTGELRLFDMRESEGGKPFRSHRSRICGVEWNHSGGLLAVGGGNGVLVCWDARKQDTISSLYNTPMNLPTPLSSETGSSPGPSLTSHGAGLSRPTPFLHKKHHVSTVKAISWCPWASELLATGGGTRDGSIRFWDTSRAVLTGPTINTNAQITSLHFAPSCREIVSTHGYAFAPVEGHSGATLPAPRKHSVMVHQYPSGNMTNSLFDASHGRITHSCISPDGTRIVTCGSDDSIRIYRIFGKQNLPSSTRLNLFGNTIR